MPDSPMLSHRFQKNAARPVILYLHGFLGCKEDWGPLTARLGEEYSHLAVDLPGHGETAEVSLDDQDFTMTGGAARLVELMDHLGIEKSHLVAYSMGGRLGLFLLTHYPGRFDRAVIESGSPGLESEGERTDRRNHDARTAADLVGQSFRDFIAHWYTQPLFSTLPLDDPRFEDLLRRRLKGNPEQLVRSLRLMGTGVQPSLWTRLGEIPSPVLFLAGERDRKFLGLAERMHRLCPQSQVAIIPGAGHNSHFERPEEFGEAVRRFLAEPE